MNSIIYDVKNLIEPLRDCGYGHLANIIEHRLYRVAWTTATELQEELKLVLRNNPIPDDLQINESVRKLLKRL